MSEVDITTVGDRERRSDSQKERRRAHFLETARAVFAARGYHQTHVSDIIEAAGVARGTFYLYFEGKAAIFIELLDNLLAEFRAEILGVDAAPGHAPLAEQLPGILTRVFNVVETNRALITIIMREAVGLDAQVEARLTAFYDELHSSLVAALEEGARLGRLRKVDNDVAASTILGGIKHMMERSVASSANRLDTERMVRGVLDYNLRALVP